MQSLANITLPTLDDIRVERMARLIRNGGEVEQPWFVPNVMLPLLSTKTINGKPVRSRVCYGGRSAARSWSFARALLVRAVVSKVRILCAREFQNSISESVHKLLSDQSEILGIRDRIRIQNTSITSDTGSEFIFSGIRNNVTKIKSMEGIDICYVEEAEKISKESWRVLIPTIRRAGSEIARG